MKWLRALIVVALCSVPVGASAWWQSIQQVGVGGAPYQGPGDIVGSASAWGSCARVYNAALASTSTSLCDLVSSSAPTVTICTLRGSSTGFVDLSSYCTGGTQTPAALCALQTGGVCNVQKIYDQTGNTAGWVQVTASAQAKITFSALNGLPGLTGIQASNTNEQIASFTLPQPLTLSCVWERTADTAAIGGTFGGSGGTYLANPASANNLVLQGSSGGFTKAGSDNVFHAAQGVINGASASFFSIDGVDGTSGTVSGSFSAANLRWFRAGASSLTGIIMECGIWPIAFSTGAGNQTLNMNANQHGTSGYNF